MKLYYALKYKFWKSIQSFTYRLAFKMNVNSLRLSVDDDTPIVTEEQDIIVAYSRIDHYLRNNQIVEKQLGAFISQDKIGQRLPYHDRVLRLVPMLYVVLMNCLLESENSFDKITVNQILNIIKEDTKDLHTVDIMELGFIDFRDQLLWHRLVMESRLVYALGLLLQQYDLVDKNFRMGKRAKAIGESCNVVHYTAR